MLMQLVCVDRRYEKMNCFNIRQLQSILKRRFFTDLVNSSDHREILSTSMIGLRFKNNNNFNLSHDTLSFFKLGTTNADKLRSSQLTNSYLPVAGLQLGKSQAPDNSLLPTALGDFTISHFFLSWGNTLPLS